MSDLEVGIEGRQTIRVTEDMAPSHLPAKVLSTPSMIGLIEMACLDLVQPFLSDTETTVGTHVNVSHTGAAMAGEDIVVTARLKSIQKRRLLFEVEVLSPRASISVGEHQRAIVDLSRFG